MPKDYVRSIVDSVTSRGGLQPVPSNHHVSRRERENVRHLERSNLSDVVGVPQSSFPGRDEPPDVSMILEVDEFETPYAQDLEGKVTEEGIDALAWYRSFHWHSSPPWGIYIRKSGIDYLMSRVLGRSAATRYQQKDRLQMAFELLLFHEFFHFLTDAGVADFERSSTPPNGQVYSDYSQHVYLKPCENFEPLEEALANAFSYGLARKRWSKSGRWSTDLAADISESMSNEPRGYSSYVLFADFGRSFLTGVNALSMQIVRGAPGNPGNGLKTPIGFSIDWKMKTLHFRDVTLMFVP